MTQAARPLLFSVQDPLGDTRTWISLDELPELLPDATVLWEDDDFYATASANLIGAAVDIWKNFLDQPVDIEASLTRRLVRNVVAPPGEIVSASDRELEIALISEIHRRFTPEEIIEWHLKLIITGTKPTALKAAARVYLGKSARELTLDEVALLAAIPTAPQFNPLDNETAALRSTG